MKTINYESEKMLPEEIMEQIKTMENKIRSHPYELDKIICDTGHLTGYLIRWFAEKQGEV